MEVPEIDQPSFRKTEEIDRRKVMLASQRIQEVELSGVGPLTVRRAKCRKNTVDSVEISDNSIGCGLPHPIPEARRALPVRRIECITTRRRSQAMRDKATDTQS